MKTPRTRNDKSAREARKLAQLCAQIEQTITLALGEAEDERLRSLVVHSVMPGPDASRLVVSLVAPANANIEQIEHHYAALEHARAWLRRQVAGEIHRKKTPELAFIVMPSGAHDEPK